MAVISIANIRDEWLFFVRNSDVMTIAERGVTTDAPTGTFASDSSHLINRINVRNIRSIVVSAVTLTYGADYTVDTDFDDSGTKKCKITFTSAQTGAFTITLDYGPDKIHADFPRDDLSISSYPRIATDISGVDSEPLGFAAQGVADITNVILTALVYSEKTTKVDSIIDTLRAAVKTNESSFNFFKYTRLSNIGPLIDSDKKQQILHRNIDFISSFNVET